MCPTRSERPNAALPRETKDSTVSERKPTAKHWGPLHRGLGLVLGALCLASTVAAQSGASRGLTHALLINGGSKPTSNYLSHLHHLEDMVELLESRGVPRDRIHVFSSDGIDPTPDLAVRDLPPPGFWLIKGIPVGKQLRPRTNLKDTRWGGMILQPARKEALREWFGTAGQELVADDRLLLFVTDHGTENEEDPDNGAISLWKEKLSVKELTELLALLPAGVRVVMVMSQCYSGTFANAMYDGGEPSGGICGFFSTARDLRAYGCYPEGRDRDGIGHAFRFIEALERRATTRGAHLEVLVTDDAPDVPLRTSDLYVERLLVKEAEARGEAVEVSVDRLLAEAWKDRAAWEPEIRLLDRIGNTFGTFSPRSLAELDAYGKELLSLAEQMQTFAESWKDTLENVKAENLRSFLSERPEWKQRLTGQALKALDAEGKQEILVELLPQLERHAQGRPEIWKRLGDLRDRAQRTSEGAYRLEVRQAALHRMRSIIVGIAGRALVTGATEADGQRRQAQQRALEQLEICEALEPGELPRAAQVSEEPPIRPFPPLADERELLEEVLPSWLGVRFGSVPETVRASRDLPVGPVQLMAIYPDSPAKEAGLEAGDLVLGFPERPFSSPRQFPEWIMTSLAGTPLTLLVRRPGETVEEDRELEITLSLRPYPLVLPELPGPPEVGEVAPSLPSGLESVGSLELPDLDDDPHLLFFWATWCTPCEQAVPEVMAFAEAKGLSVLAISEEDADTVAGFLEKWRGDFFELVAVDPFRRSFITYGVSGTPTILLVDGNRIVRHRQVGYKLKEGLSVEGWSWSKR